MKFARWAAAALLAGCSLAEPAPSTMARLAAVRVPSGACPTAGSGHSEPRAPEIINEFVTVPSGSPVDFEIPICGNWAAQLGTQPLYGPYDAFCPPSQGASDPCDSGVTYDPTLDVTTVSFSGSALYQNIPGHAKQYHFGMLSTWYGESTDNMIYAPYWTYRSPLVANQATVSVNWDPNVTQCKRWRYATVFLETSLMRHGTPAAGQWMQTAYCATGLKGQPRFTFANYGSQPLHVLSSGVVLDQPVPKDKACYTTDAACAEDMKILGVLNYAGMPPPGTSGSPFQKLVHPPRGVLQPIPFP